MLCNSPCSKPLKLPLALFCNASIVSTSVSCPVTSISACLAFACVCGMYLCLVTSLVTPSHMQGVDDDDSKDDDLEHYDFVVTCGPAGKLSRRQLPKYEWYNNNNWSAESLEWVEAPVLKEESLKAKCTIRDVWPKPTFFRDPVSATYTYPSYKATT